MKPARHICILLLLVASSPARGQIEATIARGATQLFGIAGITDFDLDKDGESDLAAMTCFENMLLSGDFPEVEKAFLTNRTIAEKAIGKTTLVLASEAGAAIAFYATASIRNDKTESIATDFSNNFAKALAGPGLTSEFDESQAAIVAEFLAGCDEKFVDPRESVRVSGVVSDLQGNPLSASITFWIADGFRKQKTESDRAGKFQSPKFYDSPVAFDVVLDGYQAQVLIQGRDFEIGDQSIEIRLKRGPFLQTESMFTQVFGLTEHEFTQNPKRWKRFWERIPYYREMAGNKRGTPLRIRDSDGRLLSEINMLQWWNPSMGLPAESVFSRGSTMTAPDSTKVFTVEFPPLYLWTAGHGGVWLKPKYKPSYGEPVELVLQSAGSISLSVVDGANRPHSRMKVLVFRNGSRGRFDRIVDVSMIEAATDEQGILQFDHVTPGTYSAHFYHEGERRRSVEFSVAPGGPMELKVLVELNMQLLGQE